MDILFIVKFHYARTVCVGSILYNGTWNVALAKVNQVETLMSILTNGNEEAEKSFPKIKEKKKNFR